MSPAWVIGVLVLAVALGLWSLRAQLTPWRIAGQLAAAALLYVCLFPPALPLKGGALVVLTPGYTDAQRGQIPHGLPVVALPGLAAMADVTPVPDLATALRREPTVSKLVVLGGGLPARDREAARALALEFHGAELLPGIAALNAPPQGVSGSLWRLTGQANVPAGGRLELRDPGDVLVASAEPDAHGRFTLAATLKGAGKALYRLRAVGAKQALIEELPVAVVVRAGTAMSLMIRAGAPDPELKYLRRWARDAGLTLNSRLDLSEALSMHEGSAAGEGTLDAATLAGVDLLVTDERAWERMSEAEKAALRAAVDGGMGLLLRVTGPIPESVASDWAGLGFVIQPDESRRTVEVNRRLGLGEAFALNRASLAVSGGLPLIEGDDGSVLARWRDWGQGRIGLWWLKDSFRLSLAGESGAYGTLWAQALAQLGRPRAMSAPVLPARVRVGERASFCAIGPDARVVVDGQAPVSLIPRQGCAAYWPGQAGWHALEYAGQRWPFYVLAEGTGSVLALAEAKAATERVAGEGIVAEAAGGGSQPGSRWPYFLAFLAVAAALWVSERRDWSGAR